jgi:hypothetical protein
MEDREYKKFTKLKVHYTADRVMPSYHETFEHGYDRKQDGFLYVSIKGLIVTINMQCIWKIETWREQ